MSIKRRIEINNHEFTVFGKAPWITLPIAETDKTPEGVIIIEASLLAYVYKSSYSPLRFNALARQSSNGALIPVVFVGLDGKARARDICAKLNDKLD